MLAHGLPECGLCLNSELCQNGVTGLLESVRDEYTDQEHYRERRENRPTLSCVSDHPSERVRQRCGYEENQEHL